MVSVPRAAKALGISKSAVIAGLRRGEIPHIRVGTLYRFRLSDVPQHLLDRWANRAGESPPDFPTGPIVYFLQSAPGFIKIGYTTDLARRVSELQFACPLALELVAYLPDGTVRDERSLHRDHHSDRTQGEWFRLSEALQARINVLAECHPHECLRPLRAGRAA